MITISNGVPVPLVIDKKSMLLNLSYTSLANSLSSTKKRYNNSTILLYLDDLSYTIRLLVFLCSFVQPLLNEDFTYFQYEEMRKKVESRNGISSLYQLLDNKNKRCCSYLSVRKLQIKCFASFDISMSSGNCNEFL